MRISAGISRSHAPRGNALFRRSRVEEIANQFCCMDMRHRTRERPRPRVPTQSVGTRTLQFSWISAGIDCRPPPVYHKRGGFLHFPRQTIGCEGSCHVRSTMHLREETVLCFFFLPLAGVGGRPVVALLGPERRWAAGDARKEGRKKIRRQRGENSQVRGFDSGNRRRRSACA